jgi:hypothetical protein
MNRNIGGGSPVEPIAQGTAYPVRMTLFELAGPTEFDSPVLVAAFDGWIDAAGAATSCANHLAAGGELIASFDADALTDYRSRRPVLDVIDGRLERISWPELALRRVPAAGRDLLVLVGPEPDFRWRQLGADVLDLSRRLGVVEWITLGAIPAAVPHTRAVNVFATASAPGLLRDGEEQGPQGLLRVPTAALSAVELAVSEAGVPSVGFYAQVPHYVGGPFASASLALLEHIERHLAVTLPTGSLAEEAQSQRARLDAAVAADPATNEYVEQLEAGTGTDQIPSGDDLATEIERFLRDEAGGDNPNPL